MRTTIILIIIIIIQLFASNQSVAIDLRIMSKGDDNIIVMDGEIKIDDTKRLAKFVAQHRYIDKIWMNSPGGILVEGIAIGRWLRHQGLLAEIPAQATCASACVYAFSGAPLRRVAKTGRLGVHMFSLSNDTSLVKNVTAIINKHGPNAAVAVIQFLEQISAQIASKKAEFLIEMSISLQLMTPTTETSHDDIYWLSRMELHNFNLVNID